MVQLAENFRRGRGRSKAIADLIRTCHKIIQETQPITVRGVCYRLFVEGHISSMSTANTKRISWVLTRAREEGIIPWEWIVDETREMEAAAQWRDLPSYLNVIERSYRRDFWSHQKNRVIVISEKSTVAGILRPVLDEYGVPFFPCHGFNSATKVHDLAIELMSDERQTVLLYCGDWDPSGLYRSEQDLPARLQNTALTLTHTR